ncbi:MAG: hypothetical protein J5636_08075 [Clostridiales bacterium]|nr:hypothetical protein [Clostridiales bacterium]
MKSNLKKIACLAVSFALIISAVGCKDKKEDDDSKDESSGCVEAAETVLEAVCTLNSKKIKKLEKDFGADGDAVEELTKIADEHDFVKAVMDKASYEIDEESVKEKKKKATIEATITFPDYEDIYYEVDAWLESFIEEIDAQKEKQYQSTTVTLEFEVEDDEYTLTNLDAIIDDLYDPMIDVMPWAALDITTDPPTSDDPTEPDPTDDPTDSSPAPTSSEEATATISDLSVKKVELSPDAFKAALEAVDDATGSSFFDFNSETDLGDFKAKNYCMGYSEDFENFYYYYEFNSVDDAKGYFDQGLLGVDEYVISKVEESDWGYAAYQYYSFTVVLYYSDAGLIYVGSASTESSIKEAETFITALCGA